MEPQPSSGGTKKYIVGIIIIALVIAIVSLAGRNRNVPKEQEEYGNSAASQQEEAAENTPVNQAAASAKTNSAKTAAEVDYTDANGFTPDIVSIKVGGTVKFVNKSSGKMWVASDKHPTHMNYDGTNLEQHCAAGATASFDQCGVGMEYSFTFDKAGSWNYHNHPRSRMGGVIIVK